MVCTFFGHREILVDIESSLKQTIIDLIENYSVDTFYVGDKGDFDRIVRKALKNTVKEYAHVKYAVIPAYMPIKNYSEDTSDYLCPYVFEKIPPRFAIVKRNNWMLNESDFVVTYVTHPIGGAAQFKERAEKSGKTVINIYKEQKIHG